MLRRRRRYVSMTTLGNIACCWVIGLASAPAASLTDRTHGQTFDSQGVKIHFTDEGQGDAVILIHGFGVNPDLNFRRQGIIAKLSEEFRVIALDLRGHGLSDKPYDPAMYGTQMCEDVIRLMDHLNIQRAQVVGYSLGGFIALKLATMHPKRLISIVPGGSGWESPENSQFLDAIAGFAEALDKGEGVGPLAAGLGGEREAPTEAHIAWVKFVTKTLNDQKALAAMVRAIPELAIEEQDLVAIEIPVFSIAGDQDPLKLSADNMVGKVKRHQYLIVEGADHLQTLGRAEVQDALIAFLREHRADGATKP